MPRLTLSRLMQSSHGVSGMLNEERSKIESLPTAGRPSTENVYEQYL
jgi:hypothetical protein